jgi:hypothetical protein
MGILSKTKSSAKLQGHQKAPWLECQSKKLVPPKAYASHFHFLLRSVNSVLLDACVQKPLLDCTAALVLFLNVQSMDAIERVSRNEWF